jgi:hypothetical protein
MARWYALSGGVISRSVGPDWASKEQYVGEAKTDAEAQRIALAHNEVLDTITFLVTEPAVK